MPNYRMIADVSKGGGVISSRGEGRKQTSVVANTIADVVFEEANTLNGWLNCGVVGPTSSRPSNASLNEHYIDTTLSKVIFSNGRGGWHDPLTGGLV